MISCESILHERVTRTEIAFEALCISYFIEPDKGSVADGIECVVEDKWHDDGSWSCSDEYFEYEF